MTEIKRPEIVQATWAYANKFETDIGRSVIRQTEVGRERIAQLRQHLDKLTAQIKAEEVAVTVAHRGLLGIMATRLEIDPDLVVEANIHADGVDVKMKKPDSAAVKEEPK